MKPKTWAKILRRFEALPLHCIDTSIILESEKTDGGRCCRRYLQLVGNKYKAIIPFPVMSEILLAITEMENISDRYDLLDIFTDIVNVRKIALYSQKNIGEFLIKIMNLDNRIEPTDAEILACGIESGCGTLVTLDKDLIHNQKLESEFCVRIRHPMELL